MTSVKSFRIDDILVGSHGKKRKGEMDVNMVTTVKATREEEIVKVDDDEDDDLSPSISPVLRSKLAEKRMEKKFMKRGKIEKGNTSTTSDDSGNSSRSSTPTDLSSTSAVTIKTTASEAPKTPLPSTSTALSSSDEGNNSNHSKGEDEKSSEGESETQPEQINNELGNISAGGAPIGNGVPMLGGSGFYPYANHPHFPIMFPMTSSGRVSVSQEEKGYPSAPSLHFSAAASATGSALVDPFLSKGRPFFGGPRHPSSGLMALGMPPTAMDFSMYSQHHPGFPGGFYGLPNMHEAATTQQKAHHQQLMNERLNYPAAMFQINRPMYGTTAAAVSAACKRKGGQIRFTNSQTAQLEKSFVQQKYLNATDRKKLAHSLGLSDRQVKTWFQNRRAKLRKCKGGICVESEVYTQTMKASP